MKRKESEEQVMVMNWAKLQMGKYPELRLLYHVPNGGYRNESSDSYIKMIVNQDYPYTKVYDNVELYFSNANQTLIESAWFTNSKQGSLVAISTDFDIREATHKLAIPRASSDLFADRMRDKYLAANYLIKRDAANGYYFSLPYIKTKYRYSSI